jgi:biopolymer transport protein ExbD
MVDAAGPKKKAIGPGVRKKSRVSLRIDMTPMVDIAFLLVIFFMTTTRFREPQAIEITLPKPGKPKKTKQSNVMRLAIDSLGKLSYKLGEDEPQPVEVDELDAMLRRREFENIMRQSNGPEWGDRYLRYDSIAKYHPERQAIIDTLTMIKEDISKLTVLIEVDPRSRYKSVIEVMDAVNYARMARFSVVKKGVIEQAAPPATPGIGLRGPEYLNTRRA